MSRTAIVPSALAPNSNLSDATSGGSALGTTIDSTLVTNGATIAPGVSPEHLILLVSNTTAGALTVTLRAGNRFQGGAGDLVLPVAAAPGTSWLGPFASARILQADGSVSIDFATGFTGSIKALKYPRYT
jgi:hypothetical protein